MISIIVIIAYLLSVTITHSFIRSFYSAPSDTYSEASTDGVLRNCEQGHVQEPSGGCRGGIRPCPPSSLAIDFGLPPMKQ